MRICFALLASSVVLLIVATGCSSSDDTDAKDVASGLADALTDALDFEGGVVMEGQPLEGSDSFDAPQIGQIEFDNDLRIGAPFAFSLSSEFADSESVNTVIVRVKGATKYIQVSTALSRGLIGLGPAS